MGVKVICCKITGHCRVLCFSTCPIWCSAPNPAISAPGWNGQVVKCKCSATIPFCNRLPLPLTVVSIVFFLYLGFSLRCQVTFAEGMVIWRHRTAQTATQARSCTQLWCHDVCQKIFIKFKAEQHTPLPVHLQYRFYTVSRDICQDLQQCWIRGKFPKQFCIFLYKVPSILLIHKRFQLNYNFTTINPSSTHWIIKPINSRWY